MEANLEWHINMHAQGSSRRADLEEKLALIKKVRAAGSWTHYCRIPHKELLRFRSLVARNRARAPPRLVKVFAPSFPKELFFHVASYWLATQ